MKLWWLTVALWGLCVAFGPTKASATLLFSGGEDGDFNCAVGGSCVVDTTTGRFRAGWAREAYQLEGLAADPAKNRIVTPPFSASSTLWVHAQYCSVWLNTGSCVNDTTASSQMIRIIDGAGNATLVVQGTGTAGEVKISSRSSSGTFTDLVTCPGTIGITLQQVDLSINYGASGQVTLYNNSVQVCTYTGDVTNGDGATTLNQAEFSSARATNGGQLYTGEWSEVIIADTDTRAMSRFTANTVADGNTVGFSGANVCSAIWNAKPFNDANYGYSGSNNVVHECTVNGTIPAGAYNVLGLVMSARALVGTSGPLHFDFVTRVSGTDYTSADFAPLPSFSNIMNYIQTTNPATSSPWAVSDFAAVGFNVGEKTKP
ncbi:hypothetical protein ACFSOZ_23300 [Mesorhizobium newzealandense]|uniref:Right-handed parallel beta-helix repeat-containing protein n=1 Tax=Mesorhizobium newzealandense TaxID=1300302 RepID=A0ABW4UD15_9HYPH